MRRLASRCEQGWRSVTKSGGRIYVKGQPLNDCSTGVHKQNVHTYRACSYLPRIQRGLGCDEEVYRFLSDGRNEARRKLVDEL